MVCMNYNLVSSMQNWDYEYKNVQFFFTTVVSSPALHIGQPVYCYVKTWLCKSACSYQHQQKGQNPQADENFKHIWKLLDLLNQNRLSRSRNKNAVPLPHSKIWSLFVYTWTPVCYSSAVYYSHGSTYSTSACSLYRFLCSYSYCILSPLWERSSYL